MLLYIHNKELGELKMALNENFTVKDKAAPMLYDDSELEARMDYFDAKRTELGYDTVWSMYDGNLELADPLFTNKPRQVTYKFLVSSNGRTWEQVTATATDGTIGGLWKAAENIYQQAKALGDWHYFVEDFRMEDDGSFTLTMGS